jgi:hypothetical protein
VPGLRWRKSYCAYLCESTAKKARENIFRKLTLPEYCTVGYLYLFVNTDGHCFSEKLAYFETTEPERYFSCTGIQYYTMYEMASNFFTQIKVFFEHPVVQLQQ